MGDGTFFVIGVIIFGAAFGVVRSRLRNPLSDYGSCCSRDSAPRCSCPGVSPSLAAPFARKIAERAYRHLVWLFSAITAAIGPVLGGWVDRAGFLGARSFFINLPASL